MSSSLYSFLDRIHNHALRLSLGAFRTSPSISLGVEATEPPLALRRKKLSLQYCLKLSAITNNPAYNAVFNSKFKTQFDRKPSQTRPLGFRLADDLQSLGFFPAIFSSLYHPYCSIASCQFTINEYVMLCYVMQ